MNLYKGSNFSPVEARERFASDFNMASILLQVHEVPEHLYLHELTVACSLLRWKFVGAEIEASVKNGMKCQNHILI